MHFTILYDIVIFTMVNSIKRQYKKAILWLLVVTFLASSVDLALAREVFEENRTATLSPQDRFDPITNTTDEKALLAGDFRENAEFL